MGPDRPILNPPNLIQSTLTDTSSNSSAQPLQASRNNAQPPQASRSALPPQASRNALPPQASHNAAKAQNPKPKPLVQYEYLSDIESDDQFDDDSVPPSAPLKDMLSKRRSSTPPSPIPPAVLKKKRKSSFEDLISERMDRIEKKMDDANENFNNFMKECLSILSH